MSYLFKFLARVVFFSERNRGMLIIITERRSSRKSVGRMNSYCIGTWTIITGNVRLANGPRSNIRNLTGFIGQKSNRILFYTLPFRHRIFNIGHDKRVLCPQVYDTASILHVQSLAGVYWTAVGLVRGRPDKNRHFLNTKFSCSMCSMPAVFPAGRIQRKGV